MSETNTVVEHIDTVEQIAVVTTPKTTNKYTVYKPRGHYHFFKVKVDKGVVPKDLDGYFSSLDSGIKFVKNYLETLEESFKVKSDRLDKERKERHAAKANPSND